MTNYNIVFEEKQYRAVAAKAAKYYQEKAKSIHIPLKQSDIPDALEYEWVSLTDPNASHGELEWSDVGRKGDVIHEPTTYKLCSIQCDIQIHKNDISKFGSQLIADKNEAILEKWALDVDNAAFHGAKNDMGLQLQEGIIGQLTSTQNLNGTDSNLSTKGYGWLAIKTLVDAIPFALRESAPPMILYMDETFYAKMTAPDRVYYDKVEWDFIYDTFMGDKAIDGRKIGKVVVTNKVLAEASDDTDGDNADTVDTSGTHSRLLLIVPDTRWIGRVVSRGFSLVGEESRALFVHQIWGWRGRAIVHNTNCAKYSEACVWA